jgi:hypothetical protein
LCIQKPQAAVNTKAAKNASSKLESLLDSLVILYCDNTGVVKRVVHGASNDSAAVEESDSINADMDLDESMRANRKLLAKNQPQSNLSAILDMHKSAKYFDESKLIAEDRNEVLDSYLKKVGFFAFNQMIYSELIYLIFFQVELTPAYLMPKVGTFCYETLKSMLHRLDFESHGTETLLVNKEDSKLGGSNLVKV